MREAQVREPNLWARPTAAFREGERPKSSAVRMSFRFPVCDLRWEMVKVSVYLIFDGFTF